MPVSTPTFQNIAGTPATPCFCEFVFRGHSVEAGGGARKFINILHFTRVAGPGTGTEAQFLTAVDGALATSLSAALSDLYVADDTVTRFMDDPTRMGVVGGNSLVGARGGDRLPDFNAVVTRKITAGRGRSYRGSNHWGPIAESDTDLDKLVAGAQGRWDDVATNLAAIGTGSITVGSDTWKLIVLSPTLSDLISNPSLFTGAIVTNSIANSIVGTMRRRKEKV